MRWGTIVVAVSLAACGGGRGHGGADLGIPVDAFGGDTGAVDAGGDAQADAGDDAAVDAGDDAGADASMDSGTDLGADAGSDAGDDLGPPDLGVDLGPSCTDGLMNQDETAADCGGTVCGACGVGLGCLMARDCLSGSCSGACDEYRLVISELRTRGPGGAQDDFVELYNPGAAAATLDDAITVSARSDSAASYSIRWTAAGGETIPAHGHFLLVGSSFTTVTGDAALSSGLTDKVSVVLQHGSVTLDAVCLYFGASPFTSGYVCEGTPFLYVGGTSTADRSFERLPGGASGSTQDTGDTATDFHEITPAAAQNAASAPVP